MESLNPMFQNAHLNKIISKKEGSNDLFKKKRQQRSDKCHSIKFPVTPMLQMKLRTYCKQIGRYYQTREGQALTQTAFNTTLLQFGLNRIKIVDWSQDYKDTKTYMHTMLKEKDYSMIGGPYGLAIQKQLSERKAVFFIIASTIRWMETGGSIEEIIQ